MKRRTIALFLILEAVLYILFMAMDLTANGGSTILLKYGSILVCLLFCILSAACGGDRLVPVALLFTAMADFFLLVINAYYLAGILLFMVTQSLYLVRLYRGTGKLWLPVRILGAALSVLILAVLNMFSVLNLASVLYYSLLLINMAISWSVKSRCWRIFALGLTFFLLCDTCVGIFNLGAAVPAGLYDFASIGMWFFYLPSQVLISLSGLPELTRRSTVTA